MRLTEQEFAELSLSRQTPRAGADSPAVAAERKTRAATPRKSTRGNSGAIQASEAEIQATLCAYLRYRGIPHTISNADQAFNQAGQQIRKLTPGWPDVTGCYQGRLLALEVKSHTGKLRRAQAEVLNRLWEAGAIVVIARSLEDLQAALAAGVHEASKAEIVRALAKPIKPKQKGNANHAD